MYFPQLTRRKNYKTKADGSFYSTYSEYGGEIAEDCQERCVYCDVLLNEIGGEGMHIDHFKPQKHFPELESVPFNLVLACAKCNRLKSDWWPEKDRTSSSGKNGFVDPFSNPMNSYYKVEANGSITALKDPSLYMINLMALNRPIRCRIRQARRLRAEAHKMIDVVSSEMMALTSRPRKEIEEKLPRLSAALTKAKQMLQAL